MSKGLATKLSALFLVLSLLCSPVCTVFQIDSFAVQQNTAEQYGVQSYTAEQKVFYDDLIEGINRVIVNGGDVEGQLVSGSGDTGVRAVNDLIFDSKLYGISYKDMVQVYLNARLAHPEFFFISNTYLTWGKDKLGIAVIDSFTTRAARDEIQVKISAELADYTAVANGKSDIYSKVRAVHDLMVERIDYAYDENNQPESAYWAHSIVGAAVQKHGTCETFAKWFAYVLNAIGVENMTVRGYSHDQPHAWNLVKMDDSKWYNIDVTWDDGSESENFGIYYGYFAIPSSDFNKDHTEDPETPEGTTCTYRTPDAEDSYAFSPYNKDGLMLDYTDDDALWEEYINTWARALDKGEYSVIIYMDDENGMTALRNMSDKFTETMKQLRTMGYSDMLSGRATLRRSYLGDHLFWGNIVIEKPDPAAVNVIFTAVNTVVNKGGESIGADGFTVLFDGDNISEQWQKTDVYGGASFAVSYTKDDIGKSYTYTMKVKNEGAEHVTYSSMVYTYVVTLSLSADNKIIAVITENGEAVTKAQAEFEQIYDYTVLPDPDPIKVEFGVTNTVENKGSEIIGADGFTVVFTPEGGSEESRKTDIGGKASFEVSYTKDDIGRSYTYTVKIKNEGAAYVTYSTLTYTYVVTLSLSKDNKIVASITENGKSVTKAQALFEQIYDYTVLPDPAPIKLTFTALSKVENKGSESIGADGFAVAFTPEGGSEIVKKTNTSGKASFEVSYTKDDIGKSYTYTVKIKNEGAANVTYSTAVYTYVVTLSLSDDNKIVASIKENGSTVGRAECEFENVYDYTPTPPLEHDLDKNNVLDREDARYILMVMLGYKDVQSQGCDINGDMIIDVRDAVMLLQIIKASET